MYSTFISFNYPYPSSCTVQLFHLIILNPSSCTVHLFHLIILNPSSCTVHLFHLIILNPSSYTVQLFHLIILIQAVVQYIYFIWLSLSKQMYSTIISFDYPYPSSCTVRLFHLVLLHPSICTVHLFDLLYWILYDLLFVLYLINIGIISNSIDIMTFSL